MDGSKTSLEAVDKSLKRLASAVDALELAADRRMRHDEARATEQEEFALMQDDRSRLAVELDAAVDRSRALESANSEAAKRLAHAAQAIERVLGRLRDRRRSRSRVSRTLKLEEARGMAQVSVTIDGRKYRLACNEGEEARLESLAGVIDDKIGEMRKAFGEIGDQRLVIMAALTIADNLAEARDEAAAQRKRSDAAEERAQALASSLDELGSRLESLAARLAGGAEG